MRWWAIFLVTGGLGAQDVIPALISGAMAEWDGSEKGGHLTVRTVDNRVYRCGFDERSYFERERQRVLVSQINVGERVEVVLDLIGAPARCYVRLMKLSDVQDGRPIVPRAKMPRWVSPTEHFAPRGNLTYAGVITRVADGQFVLRTRAGDQTLLTRQDTRYFVQGTPAEAESLKVNARVFVRAGRNLENDLEAYQVISGEILRP